MNILIVGVTGFIGQHLYQSLDKQGHSMTGCSRHPVAGINWKEYDFTQRRSEWANLLDDIDVVVNAAGIYHQSKNQTYKQVHTEGPIALFAECEKRQINVLQLSAIGAEQTNPSTEFLRSKHIADDYLLESDQANVIFYPGIVLGEKGKTTRQLSLLASLVITPIIFDNKTQFPLISIYQLGEEVSQIVNNWPAETQRKTLLASPESIEDLLENLRHWMGMSKGRYLHFPVCLVNGLINGFFQLFPRMSFGSLNKDSIKMLAAYLSQDHVSTLKETASESLMQHSPSGNYPRELKNHLLYFINIFILGAIWIFSGLISIINIEESRAIIAPINLGFQLSELAIYAGAFTDVILGILLFIPKFRHVAVYLQIFVIILYSMIISIFLPIYWLHPFAPVVKNLAMLVMAAYILNENNGERRV